MLSRVSPAPEQEASAVGMSGSSMKPYWTTTCQTSLPQVAHLDPVDFRHAGHLEDAYREDDHLFVQAPGCASSCAAGRGGTAPGPG